nr:immunoglobulin heavy chain junction region [Homo sapiens]
PIHHLQRQFQE